ncbi:F-box/kelch-repeat protein At3g06240-like isoform X1 [Durio zibethinus]|uniref:F-box/kelch-repeat protein At3g06240-like isoform X1 n=2 Tax=Durio zibethinus TaxID=66656 RepID=A0A6P5ZTE8_DURZI|nr:F-box/kelch-repeat protein At3g06240-like isoform X1 [Durio zibethinus]XP_022756009.1 F-box/kelch-repeat protein At3g06240-like isoform X1 [Durio zibethinus]XP_022756010.1 F-box/kelch-repeat protein At3g06240-like isoform X1 [Durio zibethinus]XP_022756011.1 F-box/kelch-repeat protein At3g06240-like isoform X1 [Durio zibethinus]
MQGWSKCRIELPETVVMEILSKLPVRSLTRFRCVCKRWCSSFQTSHFSTKHQHNNLKNNNLNLLLKRCHGNTHDDIHYFSALSTEKGQNFLVKENIHLPFFQNCWFAPVVSGPCNGLLCLHDAGKVALWNPSTREFKILPQSSVQRPSSVDSTSFGCLGFGFDSKTDDYKVVRFVTNYFKENEEEGFLPDWNHQVELYSLKNDSWKEISVPEAHPYGSPLFNNYINGFYYWQATGDSDYRILSFDMANENFATLPLPKFGGSLAQYYLQLLDFNGLLGAIVYPREGTEKSFDLWVMNGSWTRQFSIESVSGVERPLGFWKNGELFLEGSNHELVLFDPATRELKNLGIHAYQNTMQLIPYVESLVPINGRSEHEEHIIRQPAGRY